MMGLNYEDIVRRIKEEKGLSDEEIKLRVKEKLNKLSGLISHEGAAHIVANELGLDLLESIKKTGLKINRLMSGMHGVGVLGKVLRSYGVREWTKEDKKGQVGSFLIADDTGMLRVVLWDTHHIKEMENGLKEGAVVRVKNGYVKDNNGFRELHLGNQAQLIVNPAGETVEVNGFSKEINDFRKKKISELVGNEFNIGVVGTIVQVFEPKFFDACPECGKKMIENNCNEHGKVASKVSPVLNFFLDDGTGNIRTVVFRDLVNELLGVNEEEIIKIKSDINKFEEYKNRLLGKQLLIVGKVNKNEMFSRIELVANKIEEVDPKKLAEDMVGEIAL